MLSFLREKGCQIVIEGGILGADEVGSSNLPSSSIETLEPQRFEGFKLFIEFVGKTLFPTILPTNLFSATSRALFLQCGNKQFGNIGIFLQQLIGNGCLISGCFFCF